MGKCQFLMNTNGHCFFCLRPPPPPPTEQVKGDGLTELKEHIQIPREFSFRNICKYLKVDLKEVCNEVIRISASSLSVLENAELKGTLCEECVPIWERFSRYFLELEVVHMKLNSCLQSVSEMMRTSVASNDGEILNQFRMEMSRGPGPNTGFQREIVERLRSKTLERCSLRSNKVSPQVHVGRISLDELTQKCRSGKGDKPVSENGDECFLASEPEPEGFQQDPLIEIGDVKLFQPSPTSTSLLNTVGNNCLEKLNPGSMGSCTPNQNQVTDEKVASKITIPKPKCIIIPTTEEYKWKCNLCRKEFYHRDNYNSHYKNVHLGIRFKCTICFRLFTFQASLKVHRQNVHFRQRFQCQFCPRTFVSQSSRSTHVHKVCNGRKRQFNLSISDSSKSQPGSTPSSSRQERERQPSLVPAPNCKFTFLERPMSNQERVPAVSTVAAEVRRGRGRPRGSTKRNLERVTTVSSTAAANVRRGRGRPRGSTKKRMANYNINQL